MPVQFGVFVAPVTGDEEFSVSPATEVRWYLGA